MGLIGRTTSQEYYESSNLGDYQFTSLKDIINQFMIVYVGENKLISKISETDILFHAQRALQELSFDTLKSCKSIEVEIPPSLTMKLPQDYVNYVKLSWSDSSGIQHIIYPTSKTSNPINPIQDSEGDYTFNSSGILLPEGYVTIDITSTEGSTTIFTYSDATGTITDDMVVISSGGIFNTNETISEINTVSSEITFSNAPTNGNLNGYPIYLAPLSSVSDTWTNYKANTPSENQEDYDDDFYVSNKGGRYGIIPEHAQTNGSYYIDCKSGLIHFSSNILGQTVILEYISDGLGTDEEMIVHKFAEDAMYKTIAHSILSTRSNVQEYVVRRFQKDKFAATRKAKLRLSNLKIEELTQILRGKSKHIKH